MNSLNLEKTALRVILTIARRAILQAYLPGPDALEPYQHAVNRALEAIESLEAALLDLDLAIRDDLFGKHQLPF